MDRSRWSRALLQLLLALTTRAGALISKPKAIQRWDSCKNTNRDVGLVCRLQSAAGQGAIANLIMASGPKTGSTGMWRDLMNHGLVSKGVACKEMHFFDNGAYFHGNRTEDWDEAQYRRRFARPCASSNFVYTDASPSYWANYLAAQRISTHLPQAKVLIIVRDPMKRFISRMIGNFEHQASGKWYTCNEHLKEFYDRRRACADRWFEGCLWDEETSSWVPTRTNVGTGLSAAVLEGFWGGHYDLTGSDGRFLALPLDVFSPAASVWSRTHGYQLLARFLGIRPWTADELSQIPSLSKKFTWGSSHNGHYEDAKRKPSGRWGTLYADRGGPHWDCSDADRQSLHEVFARDNGRLRVLLTRQELRKEMPFAWPPWLRNSTKPRALSFDALDAMIDDDDNGPLSLY